MLTNWFSVLFNLDWETDTKNEQARAAAAATAENKNKNSEFMSCTYAWNSHKWMVRFLCECKEIVEVYTTHIHIHIRSYNRTNTNAQATSLVGCSVQYTHTHQHMHTHHWKPCRHPRMSKHMCKWSIQHRTQHTIEIFVSKILLVVRNSIQYTGICAPHSIRLNRWEICLHSTA